MAISVYADFTNADTLAGVTVEPAKVGTATVYLRYMTEAGPFGERALAISLQEFDYVAREVARWRALRSEDEKQEGDAP